MANQSLISGAGKAVKKDPKLVKSLGYAKIGEQMFDTLQAVAEEKIKLKNEFDKSVNSFLNKSGEYLDENVLSDVMDTLEADRKKYIWGSKKEKLLLKTKMEKLRVEYAEINDSLNELGERMEDPFTLANDDWKETNEGQSITGIFNGTNKAVSNPNAVEGTTNFQELGFMVVNESGETEWKSRDEIAELVKINSRDGETDENLQKQVGLSIQFASNKIWTNYYDYNETRFRNNIKQIVDGAENINSLTNDAMAGLNDSFYDNLTNALVTKKWEDIGLTADQIEEYGLVNKDVDGDGVIDEDDAKIIAKYFTTRGTGANGAHVNELGETIWE